MSLSVLLPVYGEASFICEAIISTLDDIELGDELIIILDRTSDNTKAIIEDFASKDGRIVVINSTEPGITNALNLGVRISSADFIARMDADDVVINGRFHKQKKFLESHPKYILIGSNIQLIDSTGRKIGLKIFPSKYNSIKRMLNFYNPIAHPSVMIRRVSMLESGLYKIGTDGFEDFYLWRKLINFGKFRNSRKCFLKYRVHANQASTQNISTTNGYNTFYLNFLKAENKSNYDLLYMYEKIIYRKERTIYSYLMDFKFLRSYFKSLYTFPQSTFILSFYYIANSIISRFYLKLPK
jgi:glycosyltransferase involved in cell wall biosynthesis